MAINIYIYIYYKLSFLKYVWVKSYFSLIFILVNLKMNPRLSFSNVGLYLNNKG